ncbi:MAG: M23 family metallopeptidase [Cyanobacteria bacterium P01_E01_bin.42]
MNKTNNASSYTNSATYDENYATRKPSRDRLHSSYEEIIDADIIEEESDRDFSSDSFRTQQQQKTQHQIPLPLPSPQQVFRKLERLERKHDRLQERFERVNFEHRKQIFQLLYETDKRIGRKFRKFQDKLERMEIKIDSLLAEQRDRESRRTILILLSILVAGIAYITIIYPLANRRNPPQILPPENSDTIPQNQIINPESLQIFFASSALAVTPQRRDRVYGKGKQTYIITDTYRLRPIHPSTGKKSHPNCLNKTPEEIDRQNIQGCILHRGVDVGTPIGTPLSVIALPGEEAKVECLKQPPWGIYSKITSTSLPHWTFISHHLKTCRPGIYKAGEIFGSTGIAGTGPHLHFGVQYRGEWMAPPLGFVEWNLRGEKPNREA